MSHSSCSSNIIQEFYARTKAAQLTERVAPQQRLCVLPHGAVVLVVEGVDGAGESPGGGVGCRQRRGGVV